MVIFLFINMVLLITRPIVKPTAIPTIFIKWKCGQSTKSTIKQAKNS